MGKIIKKNIRGINLRAKLSLLAALTLFVTMFMCNGLYMPLSSQADPTKLLHNSDNLGTSKGTWGLTFTCSTCHNPDTSNVKRIAQQVNTPFGLRSVTFTRMTANSNDATGVMGSDERTYATNASTNICEVCHSKTLYHRYSSATLRGAATLNHKSKNFKDCSSCHSHQTAFKGSGHDYPNPGSLHKVGMSAPFTSCVAAACHDTDRSGNYPAATPGNPPDCKGCHSKATNFYTTGSEGCQDCHGTTSGTALMKGRPNGGVFPNISGSHNRSGHIDKDCAFCHSTFGTGSINHGQQNRDARTRADSKLSYSGEAGTNGVWNGIVDMTCSTVLCHDDGTGVLVTTPEWGSNPPLCTACHASRPDTGSHLLHLSSSNIACASCHIGAVEGVSNSTLIHGTGGHGNGVIDVYKTTPSDLGYGVSATKVKGSAYTTCTTASCHVDPSSVAGVGGTALQKVSATWGNTAQEKCTTCHAASPTTGSHTAHYNASFTQCAYCHKGAVAGTTLSTSHNNNVIDVYNTTPGDLGYTQAKTIGSTFGKCTASTCHDNGKGDLVESPVWGANAANCTACHAAIPLTGAHVNHTKEGVNQSCGTCHKGAVLSTSPSLLHMNGFVDVYKTTEGDYGYPSHKVKGSAASYCSTASCHGRKSPVWDQTTNNYQCTKCHGSGVAQANYSSNYRQSAPGYGGVGYNLDRVTGTVVGNVNTDAKIGAHDTHLRALNSLGKPASCTDCHVVPAVALISGHMDGSSLPTFSNFVQNKETFPGSVIPYTFTSSGIVSAYNPATGVCSNTYCHGSTMSGGTDKVPAWTNGNYLTGVRTNDCGKCHGFPPAASSRYAHTGVTTDTACSNCHPHNGTRANTSSEGIGTDAHINGKLESTNYCDSCHDYDTRTAGASTVWGKNQMGVEGFGAHAMHIDYLKRRMNITTLSANFDTWNMTNYNGICGTCHTRNPADHHQNDNGTVQRKITFGGPSSVRLQFGPDTPTYNGVTYQSSASTPKTCSNTSCHYKNSPIWQAY